jgi:aminopeptidase-like protein
MPHRQFEQLREEMYEVLIDSSLDDGYLTYGEYLHKGETADEFLLLATSAMTGRIRCSTSLIDLPYTLVCSTAQKLQQHGLLDEIRCGHL